MRPKIDALSVLDFPLSHLALTQSYYAKYKTISKLLDQTPELVALAHGDPAHSLAQIARSRPAKTGSATPASAIGGSGGAPLQGENPPAFIAPLPMAA